jgi:hypothetical protein
MRGNPTSISKPYHTRKEEAIAVNRVLAFQDAIAYLEKRLSLQLAKPGGS